MGTQAVPTNDRVLSDWATLARELGPRFAARASSHDAADSFVADNYRDLREHRVFSAGVPAELGGGGASHADVAMEVGAGAGFYRDLGLERLFRDVQGALYHYLRGSARLIYAGRVALGLDVNGLDSTGDDRKEQTK